MSDTVTIIVDDAAVQGMFAALIARATDMTPLMAEISEYLVESSQNRFRTGTDPAGVEWPALKDGSGRTPLLATGTMRDQIYPGHGPDYAEVVATAKQARWHQEGTDPYVIEPDGAGALMWPGAKHPVGKVNHPGLPARAFIGVSAEDAQTIVDMGEAYLDPDSGPAA